MLTTMQVVEQYAMYFSRVRWSCMEGMPSKGVELVLVPGLNLRLIGQEEH